MKNKKEVFIWKNEELQRQRTTLLYERLALSQDKEKLSELSTKGHKLYQPKDIIKNPFVLEFLVKKISSKELNFRICGVYFNPK